MADNGIHIEFPREDAQRFMATMERASRELGISVGESVKLGGKYLIRSVAASTAVAPKRRKVEAHVVETPRILKSGRVSSRPRRQKVWGAYRYISGVQMWKPLTKPWPKNATEAKQHWAAQISMRGLAKSAWWWSGRGVGVDFGSVASNAVHRMARQQGTSEVHLSGLAPYAIFRNRVGYAAKALANGPRDVAVAMRKAASQMQLYIGRKMKEAIAK